jgi:hypothetical protein
MGYSDRRVRHCEIRSRSRWHSMPSQRHGRGTGVGVLTLYAPGAALSAESALAPALTSASKVAVHTVNLGEHVFGSGLHLQVG